MDKIIKGIFEAFGMGATTAVGIYKLLKQNRRRKNQTPLS